MNFSRIISEDDKTCSVIAGESDWNAITGLTPELAARVSDAINGAWEQGQRLGVFRAVETVSALQTT